MSARMPLSAERIAESRTTHMTDRDGADFMTAYYAVLSAAHFGRDLDALWMRAQQDPATSPATLAGPVEGLAVARGGAR